MTFFSDPITIIPLALGALLLAACVVVIISRKEIPNMLAGFLVVGSLLCVAPTLKTVAFKGWGLEINVAKELKDTKDDLGSQIAQLRGQVANLEKKVGLPVATAVATTQPTVLISYDSPRRELALKIQAELVGKGYSATAVYDDLTQVQNRLSSGSNAMVYTSAQVTVAKKILADLKIAIPELSNIGDTAVSNLSAAPIQIRLF
jgi:hypothetical protein